MTRPPRLSKLGQALAYQRFVDFLHAVHQRRYEVICHPADKTWFADAMVQVLEDPESWPWDEAPNLNSHPSIPRFECFAFDTNGGRVLTMDKVVNSERGFGRFGGYRIPDSDDDHDPWRLHRVK